MTEQARTLVCGTLRGPNSEEAHCARCNALIYPTRGSAHRAAGNQMEMICIDCFNAMPAATFAGVMHHGNMVTIPNDQATALVEMFERYAHRRRLEQRKDEERKHEHA